MKLFEAILFALIQAMVINGIKDSAEEKMILEKPRKWVIRNLGEWWSKPIIGCIRCMSSFWGAVTYWPTVLYWYGFEWWQLPVFVADVFVLVFLTWFLYKRQ